MAIAAAPSTSAAAPSTSVQISMHPRDTRIVRLQLRACGGHYGDTEFAGDSRQLTTFLEDTAQQFPKLIFHEVDYAPQTRAAISASFFGSAPVPIKSWDGCPLHADFYGLHVARADYVLHLDCDMLFGGGSQTWLAEAIAMMKARPDVLFGQQL